VVVLFVTDILFGEADFGGVDFIFAVGLFVRCALLTRSLRVPLPGGSIRPKSIVQKAMFKQIQLHGPPNRVT
jgi:hypothetical protein